jgi:hypothetical protein
MGAHEYVRYRPEILSTKGTRRLEFNQRKSKWGAAGSVMAVSSLDIRLIYFSNARTRALTWF